MSLMIQFGTFEQEGELFLGCLLAVALFVIGVMAMGSGLQALEGEQTWLGGKVWAPTKFRYAFGLVLLSLFLWTSGLFVILHLYDESF